MNVESTGLEPGGLGCQHLLVVLTLNLFWEASLYRHIHLSGWNSFRVCLKTSHLDELRFTANMAGRWPLHGMKYQSSAGCDLDGNVDNQHDGSIFDKGLIFLHIFHRELSLERSDSAFGAFVNISKATTSRN